MKKSIIIISIIMLICVLLITPCAAWSGSGTQADPYIITSQSDLERLSGSSYASYVGNDKYFELGADITMSGTFTPIGTSRYKFNGHFDGKNHKITGLKTSSNPSGLFMYVTSGAEMKNINFYNAQISGTGGDGTGVLYGQCNQATNLVIVSNVNVYDSEVTSIGQIGGISGYGAYLISEVNTVDCNVERSAIISVSGGSSTGGISGYSAYDRSTHEIKNCNVNECIISTSSGNNIGGISGSGAYDSSTIKWIGCNVTNCAIISSGSSNYMAGGISSGGAFYSSTSIAQNCNVENCYIYVGRTNGVNIVGGIFGYGTYNMRTSCTITNCHVSKTTIIAVDSYAGGIYGCYRYNGVMPVVTDCTVTDCTIIAKNYSGGITGGYSSS